MKTCPRLSLLAASALGFLAAPTVASAQALPAGITPASLAKSEAILGGAPSALAAIMAQQSGMPAPVLQAAALQPAGYRPMITQAVLRTSRPLVSPAVLSGRPDVFGSVAVSIGRTKLDARWHRVENAPVTGAAAGFAASLRDLDTVARAEAVNRYVNHRVRFTDDSQQYGRNDVWAAASETLSRGKGDCEDYAIAKMQMLRAAGVADRDLYLVVLKDLVRRADHAVLVVRAGGRMLLLDNGTDVMADTETVRDYRPVLTFSMAGSWTHGYRRTIAPVEMASAVSAASTAALAPSAY